MSAMEVRHRAALDDAFTNPTPGIPPADLYRTRLTSQGTTVAEWWTIQTPPTITYHDRVYRLTPDAAAFTAPAHRGEWTVTCVVYEEDQ